MSSLIAPIGHRTLCLDEIHPDKSPSFSPMLYEYMKKHGHFYTDGGVAQTVFVVRDETADADVFGAGALLLGFRDERFLTGTRLMAALGRGAKAEDAAYPVGSGVEEVEGFWDNYLRLGRCAIDPAHQDRFQTDRFDERYNSRVCRWCGHAQFKRVVPRIEYDTSWISVTSGDADKSLFGNK